MTKLPMISGEECIRTLQRLGYKEERTHGSHVWMVCPGRQPIPVPKHKELGRGILRKIISMAEISVEEFVILLKI
jgi:predicted RNA binding protein YcfA (HicA-like mRNA interferase family)